MSVSRFKETGDLKTHVRALHERPKPRRRLWVCGGPGCLAAGGATLWEALEREAERAGVHASAEYKMDLTGCLGLCERGPLIEVEPEGSFYQRARPEDAADLVNLALLKGEILERLSPGPKNREKETLPFYQAQTRRITRRFGAVNPESLDDYLATGGYEALALALDALGPEGALERVERSGLRGRGGGGFPAGRKWRALKESAGVPRYILANGDEGDPGAFMNRALMEGDPFSVIEGMTIGAYALGAEKGFIYVRHEYPLSVKRLDLALKTARERGLLGENVLGKNFSFDIEIQEGGGAFVCGESTALMASIEGREGVPRVKYVRSTEAGLWDKPALLQNVETWANVPLIVLNGPEWFRKTGGEKNPGTKVFSLVGQVENTGLVELPLGTKVGTLVEEIGGGVKQGRTFKAAQSGGPSGGCLPRSALELPLDFDRLSEAGAMMGSGGLIVLDDLSCMVDTARYFTGFLAEESCGGCAPCREGLPLMFRVLSDLCQGKGRPGDADFLEKTARHLSETALCGLGRSAANPVLSTLRYFRDEYLDHERGFCPAGRCSGLYLPEIDPDKCRACSMCQKACPAGAVAGQKKEPRRIIREKCVSCGSCLSACRFASVKAVRREAYA
ncbi:MAG: NAD(P)H-dependent oxidoreductase subunit E [Deltaproteobacteria bacterium]|jgi:NADH-quinone oxidoreductase subunit F|nr:NAD(P)H-dependent oxidoreductase subunit E [Deltaproteobacteria bacterium]